MLEFWKNDPKGYQMLLDPEPKLCAVGIQILENGFETIGLLAIADQNKKRSALMNAQEKKVREFVNAEREKAGLDPVTRQPEFQRMLVQHGGALGAGRTGRGGMAVKALFFTNLTSLKSKDQVVMVKGYTGSPNEVAEVLNSYLIFLENN